VLVLSLYVARERHARAPLLPPELFRSKALRAAIMGMPGQVFAYQGTVLIGLLLLEQVLGYEPATAGLAFGPLGAACLVGSPLTTVLLRRFHWTTVVACAQGGSVVALLVLALARPSSKYLMIFVPCLVLVGLSITVAAVALNMAAGNGVKNRNQGGVFGLFETSTHLSGTLVVASLTTVAAARSRSVGMTDDPALALSSGYRLAFLVAALAALCGGVLTLMFGHTSRDVMSQSPVEQP
jgi:MFS family permease